jgi:nicotinamide phosphoribosyltransferase
MDFNPLLLIDGYKVDHRRQYPDGTSFIFSNLTPRYSRRGMQEIVFFGLQYYLQRYLKGDAWSAFFDESYPLIITDYEFYIRKYLKTNLDAPHMIDLRNLGYLPIEIWALPEGSQVPIGVPPLVIFNTHPDFAWLVNYLETSLSATIWGMCTSATTAYEYRKILDYFANVTGDENLVKYQAHDFSMRGMFGIEAAAMSGAAHLTSFDGTDTLPAIQLVEQYYNNLVGAGVPATEHSVMCAGGKDNELETIKRLITEVYPSGVVSIVADTWDFWDFIYWHTEALKDQILARDGKVVFRPDSGDPVKIICGDVNGKTQLRMMGAIEILWLTFGGTINAKGYKELDPHVGLIYGDSITPERAKEICARLKLKGFASTNVVFGVGSYSYQYATRDTDGYAVKATYAEINGEKRELFKDPVTDSGIKKSAKGLLAVYKDDKGKYELKQGVTMDDVKNCEYQCVFKDGKLMNHQTMTEIRRRLNWR